MMLRDSKDSDTSPNLLKTRKKIDIFCLRSYEAHYILYVVYSRNT
jgi:hypothetical protein